MATTDFDTTSIVSIGDVLVYKFKYSATLKGGRVLDYTWLTVDGVEVKYWAVQHGHVEDNKFVLSEGDVFWIKAKDIQHYGYKHKWTPDAAFKDGDFLVSSSGQVFYHENKYKVWKLKGAGVTGYSDGSTYAALSSRQKEFGTLKVFTTANGSPFRNVLEGKHHS